MPVVAEGMRQLATQVPEPVYLELMRLLGETGRSLSKEVTRALERHMAAGARPRVVEPAMTPERLDAPPKKPARKRKA